MKLIKALAASAFSAALFAPASFAATSVEIPVNHTVSYSCSVDQTPAVSTPEYANNVISATITDIELDSYNNDTKIQYTATSSEPSGTFVMKVGSGNGAGGFAATAESAYSEAQTLQVKWTGATDSGLYSAVVTATCVQS